MGLIPFWELINLNSEVLAGLLGLLFVTFLGFIVYCFALPCNQEQSAGHANISCARNKEALSMVSVLDNELQEKLGERVDRWIQDPLEALRLHLESCHKQEPKSAVIADDMTRILTLINEVSELRKSRDVSKIIEKLEKIVDQIISFRGEHNEYVSDEIFEEVKKAISFCKEEVKKTERIKQIGKNIDIVGKLPSNREGFEIFLETIEDLAEIVDDDIDFFPKESLKTFFELSISILEKTHNKIENSAIKEKLRRRVRYVSHFVIQKISEIDHLSAYVRLEEEPCRTLEEEDVATLKDFLHLSTSSLNKIWLDPEEDEAWKDL